MSINDFIRFTGRYQSFILIYFAILPLLALLINFIYRGQRNLNYLYSVLIYLSSIPGTISATLIFYTMFIVRRSLLSVNSLIYFVPVISMVFVFLIIAKKVKFDILPGFGRISGLMLVIGLASIVVLFLYRMRIFVGFFGSMQTLLIAGVVVFFLFKFALKKISGS